MKRLIATAIIFLTPALACAHEQHGTTDGNNNQGSQTQSQPATNNSNNNQANNNGNNNKASNDKSMLPMPKDAKVIATAEADELHIFPELPRSQRTAGNKQGANTNTNAQGQGQAQTQPQQVEEVAKVRALDTVYSTDKSYQDTVKYFDDQAKQSGMTQLQRTVTPTATGWTFKLSNGRAQDVIVRNTKPTTIETVQASESESPLR